MASPTNVLLIVSFLDMLSAGLLMPQLAPHAKSLGFSHILIGSMGAIYSGFQLVSGPLVGSLSDLKGRKPILVLSLCVCGLAYLSLGLTSSIALFLGLRAVLGLTKQTQLLTKALAPDYEKDGKKQSVVYGRLATLSGAGMSLGPIISGHVIEAIPESGFTIICLTVGAIFALNSVLIKNLPDPVKIHGGKKDNKAKEVAVAPQLLNSAKSALKQSVEELYKIDWSIYWDVFMMKLFVTLCMGLYFSSFALYLKSQLGVTPKNLGYVVAFQGAVGSLCTYFIGFVNNFYKNDRDFSQRVFHVFLVLTFSILGMALSRDINVFVALLVPLAVSSAVGRVVTIDMIVSRSHSSHRGTVIGASNSVRSLSGVVTPLISGIVTQYLGITYVLFFAAFFAAAGTVSSYQIRSKTITAKKK